ncbi:putative LRR receptor-like serine/threonine-protein kinase [Camellia lanceoleosa]|uniref:LRR receptor-like serine/threonine-protein kinase n=1 Tax=Camellia lanceoleosa TaxID=1840588 RepID=A0ACC0GU49_9ERIC|nr:putative LRR receptor-like serine/threonine-protein kinase [Camellia lanceoleosa]
MKLSMTLCCVFFVDLSLKILDLGFAHSSSLALPCLAATVSPHLAADSPPFRLIDSTPSTFLSHFLCFGSHFTVTLDKEGVSEMATENGDCNGDCQGNPILALRNHSRMYGNDLKIENILLDKTLTAKINSYNISLPSKVGNS